MFIFRIINSIFKNCHSDVGYIVQFNSFGKDLYFRVNNTEFNGK